MMKFNLQFPHYYVYNQGYKSLPILKPSKPNNKVVSLFLERILKHL